MKLLFEIIGTLAFFIGVVVGCLLIFAAAFHS
jgi:hypothetical protein